jgi:sugar phosphate isomerase/epimerase
MVGSQPWRSQPRVPPKLVVAKVALTGGTGFLDSKIAVKEGLYTPLGQGDVDVTAIIGALLGQGYTGWFLLEQDLVMHAEPASAEGPQVDAAASVEFLHQAAQKAGAS